MEVAQLELIQMLLDLVRAQYALLALVTPCLVHGLRMHVHSVHPDKYQMLIDPAASNALLVLSLICLEIQRLVMLALLENILPLVVAAGV